MSADDTNQPRRFSDGERRAVARVFADLCAKCGNPVHGAEAHVDHIYPFVLGGPTELANAQLLCRTCSLKKGAKPHRKGFASFKRSKPALVAPLRPWQRECLDMQLAAIADGKREGFVAAGVGAGKTTEALALYLDGDFDMIFAVTPKSGIRGAWHADAAELGVELNSIMTAADFRGDDGRKLPHGYVLNAQIVPSIANDLLALCAMFRVLLVVDEAHHMGEDLAWSNSVVPIAERAAFVLAMSGTPYRSDERRIRFLRYEREGSRAVAAPDYLRHYWQSLEAGEVAPIVTRFIGGSVTKHADNAVPEVYDYADGDYSTLTGGPDETLMGTRLRLSAVECIDWQMAALGAARRDLMQFRADSGQPWGGLIVTYSVDQARNLAAEIERRWGDRTMVIVDDVQTEDAVELFRQDTTYTWAVSITKISEGISIERLRVGALLSLVTTRNALEQIKGRLARLVRGIPQLAQVATFYVPADPRLIDHVMKDNEITLHSVSWLSSSISEAEAAGLRDRVSMQAGLDLHGADLGLGNTTPAMVAELMSRLRLARDEIIEAVGAYTLVASARLDGAALEGNYVSEEHYRAARDEIASIIRPLTAARMKGEGLDALRAIFDDGKAHGVREIFSALIDVAGLSHSETMRAACDAARHSGADDVGEASDYLPKPPGYWTLEQCKKDALRFTNRTEWRAGSSSYSAAAGNGWLNLCAEHMVDGKRPNGYWTKEQCVADAKQFSSLSKWRTNSPSGYSTAKRLGWTELCTAHMVRPENDGWTLDKCAEIAKKFKGKTEWLRGHWASHAAAKKHGWYAQCTEHMQRPPRIWDAERCRELALRHSTVIEWQSAHKRSYRLAKRMGLLEMCTEHMAPAAPAAPAVRAPRAAPRWPIERCKEEAQRFDSRTKWAKGHPRSYDAARKRGWLDECTEHMISTKRPNGHWSLERCVEDAKRFKTRRDWQEGSPSANHAAYLHGWMDQCTAHMQRLQHPHGYWTRERCKETARQFTTSGEWLKRSSASYDAAVKKGWLDECTQHMPRRNK